ncbi:MAG: hypothetical protein NC312_08505 [Bacteroides fragilis]|nr:hypothetical protein [Bacteroides fragilis]
MRDLQQITKECIKKIKDTGIPVQDDKIVEIKLARTNAQGKCLLTTEGKYYIRISPLYNDEKIDICELEDTVIHELLHTCPA